MILKRIASREQSERTLHEGMRVAMTLLNWILPDTEAVVKARSHVDDPVQLPDELNDPLSVLDRAPLKVH